ncbi:MAG: porin family protein [Hyphomicrobiales bacterium]|nr:porin family protein [Hyphomicrobiales bacterium]
MLRTQIITLALIGNAGIALAADLPSRVAPAPFVAAPVFTWTGFYLGLNAGAGFNVKRDPSLSSSVPLTIYTGSSGNDSTPFTGGVTAGYNMQFGSFVAGVEADINYLRRPTSGAGIFPAPANLTPGYDNRVDFALRSGSPRDWFGTARGRLGFAFDRVLVYGTGGVAFSGKQSYSVDQREIFETTTTSAPFVASGSFVTNPTRSLGSNGSNSKVGWALGAGAEYAVTNAISLKLEYLHVDFGRTSQTFTTIANAPNATVGQTAGGIYGGGDQITVKQKNNFDLVRAGVNFRF